MRETLTLLPGKRIYSTLVLKSLPLPGQVKTETVTLFVRAASHAEALEMAVADAEDGDMPIVSVRAKEVPELAVPNLETYRFIHGRLP